MKVEESDTIRMANQIADFFKSYGPEEGKKELAAHINSFWEPRMRAKFFEYVDAGGKELAPLVMDAVKLIRRPENHKVVQSRLPKHGSSGG
ncbi:MAG: formate dehydrogenase subunit delta [Alphaproteobacteria bacterium]|nr:formate dehydrogenase subunit delta [Alphaproteobacteria bacterium]